MAVEEVESLLRWNLEDSKVSMMRDNRVIDEMGHWSKRKRLPGVNSTELADFPTGVDTAKRCGNGTGESSAAQEEHKRTSRWKRHTYYS